MSDVKWIKLSVDIFDNAKIKHIRRLPEGNNILLIWVMLLTMAGKSNSDGYILLTKDIPYTIEMLADELNFNMATINLALNMFSQLGMIELDNGAIFITGWSDHQNFEKLDKIKEQNRLRQAKFRENKRKAKELLESNVTLTLPVTLNNATDIDIDKDKNNIYSNLDTNSNEVSEALGKNTEGVGKKTDSKNTVKEVEEIYNYWNSKNIYVHRKISDSIIKAVKKARKIYSLETIKKAIDMYTEIYFSKYYYNYIWKLDKFLSQGNGISNFIEDGEQTLNYKKQTKVDKPQRVINTELDFNYKSDAEFDQF